MLKEFRKLIRDESGATAIEYALIASLISVAIIAAATNVGTSINGVFTAVSTKLAAATPG